MMLLNMMLTIALAVITLTFGLLLRKLFPQAHKIFSRASMGGSKAFLLWLFFSVVYIIASAFSFRIILYHIHLSALATKLNVPYAELNLIITILSIPLAVVGETLVLLLFIKNIQMLPHDEVQNLHSVETGKTWPPPPSHDH